METVKRKPGGQPGPKKSIEAKATTRLNVYLTEAEKLEVMGRGGAKWVGGIIREYLARS